MSDRGGPWRVVTVGGLAGTGTTTLCATLQDRLGLPYVYAGRLFRDEARRRGLSLAEFGELCQDDPEVDQALDQKQVALMQEAQDGEGLIMEGRLAGWMAHRHRIHALKVWLVCDEGERMRRITDRDGGDLGDQIEATEARERSEADRYARYYGIDLGDLSPHDLVLDSTHRLPEDLAAEVERVFRTV